MLIADPTKCTAEEPGTKVAEVSKSALLKVCTMYQNGKLCEEKQVVEVELKSDMNDFVTHAKVTSKGREFIRSLTLQKFVGGMHSLIVKWHPNCWQSISSAFKLLAVHFKCSFGQFSNPVAIAIDDDGFTSCNCSLLKIVLI